MIHFGPDVRIKYFVAELLPMFLNASMWSNRAGIDVIIEYIGDDTNDPTNPYGVGLTMRLDADTGTAADRHALFCYLYRTMPRDFAVIENPDHVYVEWWFRRPLA
jgi:hypothetical protein